MLSKNVNMFIACPPGVEVALAAELARKDFRNVEMRSGGAKLSGPVTECWRAVLQLTNAVRVYRELSKFRSSSADELYQSSKMLKWERYIRPGMTFAIDSKASDPNFVHSNYVSLKVKDAIVDRLREVYGERPDVDAKDPDVRIFVLQNAGRAVISLDMAGRSLHKRGYRVKTVPAPISEVLASAAVEYSGWDGKTPFYDPMCGSGTILIEAGMRASNMAPGLIDPDFVFKRLPEFRPEVWEEMLKAARDAVRIPDKLVLKGSDADPDAVVAARANAKAAGLDGLIKLDVADLKDFKPQKGAGVIVSNPPYGLRLEDTDKLIPLFNDFGKMLISRCPGFAVHLFLPDARLSKATMLKPAWFKQLSHGGLKVRLYRYEIGMG